MIEGASLLAILAGAAVWLLLAHARLIRAKSRVYDTWAETEDALEKRDETIVTLGMMTQGRMGRDQNSGARVARLAARCREAYGAGDVGEAEAALAAEVRELLHVAALSPGMLGDPEAADLPGRISRLDAKAAAAAEAYNVAARELNVLVEAFPSSLAAKIFGFRRVEYFEPEKSSTDGSGTRV